MIALPPPPAAVLPAAPMGRGGSRAAPAATALPDEVWEHVFSFLPGPADSDRGTAAAACRSWLHAERRRPSVANRYAACPQDDVDRVAAALPWHVLPDEVWEHVFSFLPGPADSDRGAAAAACRPSLADRYAAVDPVPDKERLSALTGSQYCHTKHGQIEHKIKCKQMKSLDPADKLSCGGEVNSSKSSALGHISLVPLPACKKISKGQVLFPYDEFLKLYNWKDLDVAPCGLINSGNSCFANVVLQCLSCTRPLVAYLLGKDHSRECSMRCQEWCFLCELQCHIHRATESLQPFAPTNILSHLPNIGGNLGVGRQEDAHELLRFAIDKMQSACLHEYGGEKAVDLSTQETTIIHHIFGGRLRSQVQCTGCGMVSNRYDNMMDLTVEIQGDADSLEKCLDQFTAIEWLDGDNKYRCDGCNDYLDARKHLSVHQAPNILTITLKRFQSGRFGKLNKRVTFPMELDLKPYMDCKDGSDLYDLYAVVVHLDTLNASFVGHYICYIKGYQGRWYKIDDCKVMVVDEDEVHAQGAYMLLYSRKTPHLSPLVTIDESVKQQQQRTVLPSNGRSHMMLADATLNCESSLKTNSIFVDLCGTSIPIQVNTETATARELVDLALQKKEIGYADVYLMYSGKIIDCASQLRLLHIPKGASFTIVPRCRAGAVMESLLINPVKFVDFVRDMKPFYRVKIPDALRHKDITGNIYIIFLSQPARCLVHMMIVCLSILHAEGKSLSGKFEVTDFLFWNGCAIIRREDWDRASKVNVILDFRKLSQIIDWLFRRRGLQPTVFPGRDGQLPAYLAELISLLRVFVHQGDSALRAYASNHPALLSFRGRIRKILELEVFYNFMEFAVKAIFKSAIGLFEGWASHIPRVDPLKETYMFNRDFSDHGMDYIEVSRNFLSHPSEQKRGGSKRSAIPIEFTEEEAEAALTLYCGPAHLHEFLLRTVTRFEFTAGVDRKLICGNEVADANARGGKSSGLDFSV